MGENSRLRLTILGVIALALFTSLLARLWHLQALSAPRYEKLAQENRVRRVLVPAPRGRILDRNGRVLAGNRSAYTITVDPKDLGNRRDEVLERLAALLTSEFREVSKDALSARVSEGSVSQYGNVVVAEDVSRDKVVYLYEHQREFPGVQAELRALREYALGPGGGGALAPHLLGYIGAVSPELLASDPSYKMGDKVGRGGVEQRYDKELRGQEGERDYEVTSRGSIIRELDYTPPSAGYDVVLSIDKDVQAVAEESLAQAIGAEKQPYDPTRKKSWRGSGGAAVVLDPTTGAVLASASFPSFDLRAFTTGVDPGTWEAVNDPYNGYPLQDRVTQGQYPPASTIKPIMAAAALREGLITPESTFACPGKYQVPGDESKRVFNDWTKYGHGSPDLGAAIAQSCDVYFYNLGWQFYQRWRREGRDVVQEYLRQAGLGARTGVDLPYEQAGRVPDPAWKIRVNDNDPTAELAQWYPGDNINMSIGQGDMLTTPLQLASAYGAVVNGGMVWAPRVMDRVVDSSGQIVTVSDPKESRMLSVSREDLELIRADLAAVISGGTAAKVFKGWPQATIPVGGKTGTAEVVGKKDYSLFVGVGPLDSPRWVVAVVIEEGGHGSESATPVARRIMDSLAKLPMQDITEGSGGGGD